MYSSWAAAAGEAAEEAGVTLVGSAGVGSVVCFARVALGGVDAAEAGAGAAALALAAALAAAFAAAGGAAEEAALALALSATALACLARFRCHALYLLMKATVPAFAVSSSSEFSEDPLSSD